MDDAALGDAACAMRTPHTPNPLHPYNAERIVHGTCSHCRKGLHPACVSLWCQCGQCYPRVKATGSLIESERIQNPR